MALSVKTSEAAGAKWAENAGRAGTAMAEGAIANASKWASATAQGADNWAAGVTSAGVKNRFRNGVTKAGAAKYSRKVQELGASRYSQGVTAAGADYKTGVEPYLATLGGLTLSGRKPKGDPANYQRVEQVGKALNAKRLSMMGGA